MFGLTLRTPRIPPRLSLDQSGGCQAEDFSRKIFPAPKSFQENFCHPSPKNLREDFSAPEATA
ncbi:hypothetical protein KUV47_01570 [Vannielia litorea]|uniref:hypothetical protein n=1 Tax=Vannielia litorea TaxID=1217970 RepID=UPI001C96D279|nr:hypothetical protein [Vannielia litorea]MBY6048213.1 hypothetical protein [Vannielia litorea]MBY6075627.1 hypothetical protein [Vannielia litorea]MBY6151885.1 hypothetical protein [Vannielia litorea]